MMVRKVFSIELNPPTYDGSTLEVYVAKFDPGRTPPGARPFYVRACYIHDVLSNRLIKSEAPLTSIWDVPTLKQAKVAAVILAAEACPHMMRIYAGVNRMAE